MTTQDIKKVLKNQPLVAAVLLARGGWLSAAEVSVKEAGEDLWAIRLGKAGDEFYVVYTASETILGISVYDHTLTKSDLPFPRSLRTE